MKLKSCPFCGSEAELHEIIEDYFHIQCSKCSVSTWAYCDGNCDGNRERAIQEWNTRATDPLVDELAEKVTDHYCKDELLKELAEALDKAIKSVSELIGYSRGVEGLHLNGDIAEWDSLRTGGSNEDWLIEFDEAASVLQKYHEQKDSNHE